MSVLSLLIRNRVSTEDLNLDVCSSLNFLAVTHRCAPCPIWEKRSPCTRSSPTFSTLIGVASCSGRSSISSRHALSVFKHSQLPHQILCTCFISIFSEKRFVDNSATIVAVIHVGLNHSICLTRGRVSDTLDAIQMRNLAAVLPHSLLGMESKCSCHDFALLRRGSL